MGKNIVVTGASRGIGYETVLELARKDHQILALARSENKLTELKKKAPDSILTLSIDLTDSEELNKIPIFVEKNLGNVDGLVNCAGALINKSFEKLTDNDWREMLDVNLLSAVQLTKSLLPFFNQYSHIVNISSMGGFQGSAKFPGLSAYSVAKGAVSILSECLAIELNDRKIRANALCIGAVQTEMLNQAFPGFQAPVSARQMGKYVADFTVNGSKFYNGKILPVALENPE